MTTSSEPGGDHQENSTDQKTRRSPGNKRETIRKSPGHHGQNARVRPRHGFVEVAGAGNSQLVADLPSYRSAFIQLLSCEF